MGDTTKERLGDYELLQLIGDGAQGRVFKARRAGAPDDAGFFAVKVLRFSGDDEKKAARFQQSADTLQKLNHPAIVRYYGSYAWHAGEWDEAHCLVMEYLDGESLHDLIKRNPRGLPWLEVKRIFTACLEGLVYAREQGLIHRDIKPSNVFITRSGAIKLIDFDIARREDGSQTSTAGWKGTFDYMAPDFVQVTNFRGDEQSDIFSLGVCLFQALTGRLPFPPLGEGAHIGYLTRWREAGATKPVVDGGLFRVLIHARALVTKCLQPAREQRMQTFQDMLTGLQAVEFRRLEHRGGDSYDLIDWLGRGTSGEVYLGRRVRDGLSVAVKRLSPPANADRFVREATRLQRSPCEGLVRYLDLIEVARADQGREFFLVLECLEGMPGFSLRQRLQQGGALPPGETVRLFLRYASALQRLHDADPPLLHGNLKPANLYAPPGRPEAGCILDPGVPRAAAGADGTPDLAGPLDYLAPEFALPGADPAAPTSDLYALGLCLFEALAGRPAFPALPAGKDKAWPLFEARARNPAPIESDAAAFARLPALVPILQQALQHDPKTRYARAAHLVRDLEALLPGLPLEDTASAPSVPTADTFVRGDDAADEWTEDAQPTSDEAGTAATTGAPAAAPSSTASPPPAAPRKHGSRTLLQAAIVVLVIGYGIWVARRFLPRAETNPVRATEETNARPAPRPPAFQLDDRFASATASAGYLTALAGELARLRQGQTDGSLPGDDVKQAIAVLERQAAGLPALYRSTFDAALGARDLKAAEACLLDWSGIKTLTPVLGLTPEQHEDRTRSMQAALASLQLDDALAGLRTGLPVDPLAPDAWPRLEEAAQQWAALSARDWQGLAQAERTTRLEAAAPALRALLERRLAAVPDVAALQTLQESAPHLRQQFAGSFEQRRTVLTQAEQGRAQFQKEVDAMLAAVPSEATTPAELARAEEVARILRDFPNRTWAGVDEAERLAAVSRVKEALLPTMAATVASLHATTLGRVTADSDLRALLAPLQELEQRYPHAILLVAAAQKRAIADVEAAWKKRPAPAPVPVPATGAPASTASVASVAAPPPAPAVMKDPNEDIVLKALLGDGTSFVPQGATPLGKDDVNDLLAAAVPVRAGFNVMDLLLSPKSGQDFLAAVDHLWKKSAVFTGPFGDRLRDAAWQVIHAQLAKLAEATLKGTIGSHAPAQQARVRRSFIRVLSQVDAVTGRVAACPPADVLRARVTLYFEEGFLQDALLEEKVGSDEFLERQIPWVKERFDKVRAQRGKNPSGPGT